MNDDEATPARPTPDHPLRFVPAEPAEALLGSGSDDHTASTIAPLRALGFSESAEERRTGRTVAAEWALWGKNADDHVDRVLRCSAGPFHSDDFREIITRYASGNQESLPQYTVCWIPGVDTREGYLAVAIHELADPDPRRSGGRVRTARGREIDYTRLFCVSYSEMAKNQVSYAELIGAVQSHQLPPGPTEPITVELLDAEPPPFPAPLNALAENVAAMLLTTRPVCVLGAGLVGAEDRLRFIERVMSLLPYGLRATLSASTWASATAKNLKLRLFFAGAKREDGGATMYVTWEQPDRSGGSAEHMAQRHYLNWLKHGGAEAVAELAGQANPVRFDPGEIRQMIANLPTDRPVTDTLEQLADGLRRRRLPVIELAVKRLRQRRNRPRSLDERKKYRQEIKRLGLFKEYPELPSQTVASAYHALLGLAFRPRLSYADYREIVSLADGPLHALLGREVLKLGFDSALPWLLTSKSATEFTDQQLMASLQEQGIEATLPITEFSRRTGKVRQEDRLTAYNFAVAYLRAYSTDPGAELRQRGYLAETLEAVFPQDRQAQRTRLKEMLLLVYGETLSEEQSTELLSHPGILHTPAFDEAVRELTAARAVRQPSRLQTLLKQAREPRDRVKLLVNPMLVVLSLVLIMALVISILIYLILG